MAGDLFERLTTLLESNHARFRIGIRFAVGALQVFRYVVPRQYGSGNVVAGHWGELYQWKVPGCQGSRVPRCWVPGCQGAKVLGC